LISSLIDKGADVAGVDASGRSPLHWAAFVGDVSTTRLLLRLGARHDVRDKAEKTALLLACDGIKITSGSDHNHAQIISLLLKNGADVFAENYLGQRCLDLVSSRAETCYRIISEATGVVRG
jgi:ankyrin repeat protein